MKTENMVILTHGRKFDRIMAISMKLRLSFVCLPIPRQANSTLPNVYDPDCIPSIDYDYEDWDRQTLSTGETAWVRTFNDEYEVGLI